MILSNILDSSWISCGKLPGSIKSKIYKAIQRKRKAKMQIIGEILDKPLISTPFRMIVSGSSGVGKTIFCKKFLSSNFITKPSKIYYFYNDFYETSPEIWRLKKIPFSPFPGLPSMDFFRSIEKGAVVIIDDQYRNCIKSNGKKSFFNSFIGFVKL